MEGVRVCLTAAARYTIYLESPTAWSLYIPTPATRFLDRKGKWHTRSLINLWPKRAEFSSLTAIPDSKDIRR